MRAAIDSRGRTTKGNPAHMASPPVTCALYTCKMVCARLHAFQYAALPPSACDAWASGPSVGHCLLIKPLSLPLSLSLGSSGGLADGARCGCAKSAGNSTGVSRKISARPLAAMCSVDASVSVNMMRPSLSPASRALSLSRLSVPAGTIRHVRGHERASRSPTAATRPLCTVPLDLTASLTPTACRRARACTCRCYIQRQPVAPPRACLAW